MKADQGYSMLKVATKLGEELSISLEQVMFG